MTPQYSVLRIRDELRLPCTFSESDRIVQAFFFVAGEWNYWYRTDIAVALQSLTFNDYVFFLQKVSDLDGCN